MSLKKPSGQSLSWFQLGLLGLFLLSVKLRFWGLGRFNTLVFDEVYYVKFAHHYLSWTPFFDGHPPLSKYLIALGMWIGNQLPIGQDTANTLAGASYTTWSYRWLNALTGSLIPLVVAGIAYQLTRRSSYTLIAGFFMALDGLFLVESRYALNNVYLVLFGLLGLWCLLLGLNCLHPRGREGWLTLSGLSFGASVAIKWNGLWFLLGAYGLWMVAWLLQWARSLRARDDEETETALVTGPSPLERLTHLKVWQVGLNWVVIPAIAYGLSWIPHLKLNAKQGFWQDFWELQHQLLLYHERVGNGPNIHPYCSPWYSWLVMWRPVAYFYQVTGKDHPLPTGKSTIPITGEQVIYDVHAIGNPALWWLSTAAILLILAILIYYVIDWVLLDLKPEELVAEQQVLRLTLNPTELWLALFLVVNYGANLLPWTQVSRCIFLYHYMGSSVFASMALAWLCDRWLHAPQPRSRIMAIATIIIIVLAFLFWLPVYLGLPLSPLEFHLRMLFPNWI